MPAGAGAIPRPRPKLLPRSFPNLQYEDVKDDWYKKRTDNEPTTSKSSQPSYWQNDLKRCGLLEVGEYVNSESCYQWIDHYWKKIGELVYEDGSKKYSQLANLALTVCSLSYGNAPERGFSINKALLDSHGYTIQEDTVVSLRIVKDWINEYGGTLKFPVTKELRQQVKRARAKYTAFWEEKKILQKQKRRNRQEQANTARHKTQKQLHAEKLSEDIERCEIGLKTAEEIIEQGNAKLRDALSGKTLNKNALVSAQTKISIGLDGKRQCEKELAALKLKKAKFSV